MDCRCKGQEKNQGWAQQGIRRYNQLVELVKMNRDLFPEEDGIYLKRKREQRQEVQTMKLRRIQEALEIRERDLEIAEDDLSS